jgi:sugar phosphate isomerase/epimerase
MFLGYNTNGLAHHAPADAVALVADLGYRGLGITLDHGWLNPYAADLPEQIQRCRHWLSQYNLRSVIETGARFVLDPRAKHEPTLMTADASERSRRIDFYRRAIDLASELGSDCVSLWSGILHDKTEPKLAWERLVAGLEQVVRHAERRGVVIGFEPEPGMFLESMTQYDELRRKLDSPALRLTLDIGHLHCLGETPLADYIARYAGELVNVHIEDMRRGVHEHLQFGEGEIDFPPVLAKLRQSGYQNGIYVELSRHSHAAPSAARHAIQFLQTALTGYREINVRS